jgi:DNA-binding MarR family transcriptional regulator
MTRHAQLELDRQLCFPLYATSRALTRAYAPLLDPAGLTYPQYLTMLALWAAPEGSTVGELGRRLHLDSGTLTPLLKRLETAGLVERHRDPGDERRVIVTVTPYGDRLQEQVAHVPEAVAAQLGLSLEEGITLHTLLHRVLRTLDDGAMDHEVAR